MYKVVSDAINASYIRPPDDFLSVLHARRCMRWAERRRDADTERTSIPLPSALQFAPDLSRSFCLYRAACLSRLFYLNSSLFHPQHRYLRSFVSRPSDDARPGSDLPDFLDVQSGEKGDRGNAPRRVIIYFIGRNVRQCKTSWGDCFGDIFLSFDLFFVGRLLRSILQRNVRRRIAVIPFATKMKVYHGLFHKRITIAIARW